MKAVIFDMFETLVTLNSASPYFGKNIAVDLGVDVEEFYPLWHAMDEAYSKGKMKFEDVLAWIGERMVYAYPERIPEIIKKRYAFKAACVDRVEDRIVSMLRELKERGYQIGLISNCYEEEALAIRACTLAPYFDVMLLSCEVGMQKPELGIFNRCLTELSVKPEECLYVGDGGSRELETARSLGMETLQAGWFIKKQQEDWRKEGFDTAGEPEEVLVAVESSAERCNK